LTEIKELVSTIKELTGNVNTKTNFGAIPYRKNEIMESNVDTTAIRKLGWIAKYNLLEGLKITIDLEKASKNN
jgi:nucleoside-diphosphate-sugar epimerase